MSAVVAACCPQVAAVVAAAVPIAAPTATTAVAPAAGPAVAPATNDNEVNELHVSCDTETTPSLLRPRP